VVFRQPWPRVLSVARKPGGEGKGWRILGVWEAAASVVDDRLVLVTLTDVIIVT